MNILIFFDNYILYLTERILFRIKAVSFFEIKRGVVNVKQVEILFSSSNGNNLCVCGWWRLQYGEKKREEERGYSSKKSIAVSKYPRGSWSDSRLRAYFNENTPSQVLKEDDGDDGECTRCVYKGGNIKK